MTFRSAMPKAVLNAVQVRPCRGDRRLHTPAPRELHGPGFVSAVAICRAVSLLEAPVLSSRPGLVADISREPSLESVANTDGDGRPKPRSK